MGANGDAVSFILFFWRINVVLVSAVQGSKSAVCIHISPPSWTSLPPCPPSYPSRSLQRTELSFPLVSAVDMVVCLCQSWSPNPSSPPLPALCLHVHSLHLHLYPCPANRFICTIFLDGKVLQTVVAHCLAQLQDCECTHTHTQGGRAPGL